MKNIDSFSNLIDLIKNFDTEEKCSLYVSAKRWGDKPVCPHCGNKEKIYKFSDNVYFKCASCRQKFTVRVGTIFEGSKIPLTKWFAAIYLFTSHKKGISSVQLAKDIKVTQKSAWFMLHRLRYGMEHPEYKKPLENVVEMDETYIGGKIMNKHASKKPLFGPMQGEKEVVFGAVERGGKVIAKHVPNAKKETLHPIIISNVKELARIITDEWYAYGSLNNLNYTHESIRHSLKEYVVGDIHTNTIENFWSGLKRGIYGIYHHTSKQHLQRYIEEFCYRFNNRGLQEFEKFDLLLQQSNNGVLPYATLIKK